MPTPSDDGCPPCPPAAPPSLSRTPGAAPPRPAVPEPPGTLVRRLRTALRARHYSRRTEEAYVAWARRYVRFHGLRHPRELGADALERFLSWLAVRGRVSAATQNQARSALVFLYGTVLVGDPRTPDVGALVAGLGDVVRAKRPTTLPTVLTRAEVRAILAALDGTPRLVSLVLYGAGVRLLEALQLRVKDLDLAQHQLTIRAGKGAKDRVTILPEVAAAPLARHLARVQALHARDLARGAGTVALPGALARKYPRVPERGAGVGVAVGLPGRAALPRRRDRRAAAAPLPRERRTARGADRGADRGAHEARRVPHVPPLLRHPPPGGRLRRPDHPGAAGPRGRADDDDLHACAESGRARRPQPARPPRVVPRRRGRVAPLAAAGDSRVWLRVLQPYTHGVTGPAAGVSRCAAAGCTASAAVRAAGVWLQDPQRSRSAFAAYSALDINQHREPHAGYSSASAARLRRVRVRRDNRRLRGRGARDLAGLAPRRRSA